MIEAGMYFVLGLATAGLLALMIAPMLWRRAVRLTRARIEHAVPASLTEVQADKDQLRAEFAMSARRLETTIETLRQKAGQQLIDVNQKRDLIRRLSEEQAKRVEVLGQLEERESELHQLLRRREDRMAEANAEMKALRANLSDRGRALEQVEQTLRQASAANEEQTVELVAKGTEIENLRDNLAAAKSRQTSLQIERTKLEASIAEIQSARTLATERLAAAERRLANVDTDRRSQLAEIDRRDREIDRLKKEATGREHAISELDHRVIEAEAANAETHARISELTLQLDETTRRDPAEELTGVMARFETERDQLAAELLTAEEALARLRAENAELQRISGDEWEAERIQNAMLRERLNDIAGEVSELTRAYQDEIGLAELNELARDGENRGRRRGDRPTGSQRIRALQRTGG